MEIVDVTWIDDLKLVEAAPNEKRYKRPKLKGFHSQWDNVKDPDVFYTLRRVSEHMGISVADIMSDSKLQRLADARQMFYFFAKKTRVKFSNRQLANIVNRTSHGAINHGVNRIKHEIEIKSDLGKEALSLAYKMRVPV